MWTTRVENPEMIRYEKEITKREDHGKYFPHLKVCRRALRYYKLKAPWAFRGWKKLPYAIQAQYGKDKHERPHFLKKEPFMDLLYCNGTENVDPEEFCEQGRQIVEELLAHDIMEQSETPLPPLESWQRYHVFPARYIKSVHWSITGKCNFNCRHCLVSAPTAHHPQLPLEDCLHIVDEIARSGITRADITGGEPLVRKDFEEIVKALSDHGIDIGVLFTNASLLDASVLDMLEKYHQHPTFQLSFDGLGHHDWLRGVPGAEKQADAAFRLLQEREYAVSVAMCIHKENKDSLRATANYLAGLGVQSLRLNAPQSLGLWKQNSREYALTEDEVWAVYKAYISDFFEDSWTAISSARRAKRITGCITYTTPRRMPTGESIPTASPCVTTYTSARTAVWPPAWAFPTRR